ncbi:DUF5348 domain-containing protein [Oscillospiraceae bacterium 50-16]
MKSLSQVMDQSMVLKNEISKLLLASTYKECSDLSALDINYGDSEQLLQLEVLRDIMEKLADIEATLDYMSLPVVEGGQLVKNAVGKYETSSGHVLHAGSMVEALIADGIYNVPYWSIDRVEHDGTDYCLVKNLNTPMDGLAVRIRGEEE